MGVYIKGMEMPESCSMCQFSDVYAYPPDYDDEYVCELKYISMRYEDAQMRHIDCPLIEVPDPPDNIDTGIAELEKKYFGHPLSDKNKVLARAFSAIFNTLVEEGMKKYEKKEEE